MKAKNEIGEKLLMIAGFKIKITWPITNPRAVLLFFPNLFK
jgi:hypothetical protein